MDAEDFANKGIKVNDFIAVNVRQNPKSGRNMGIDFLVGPYTPCKKLGGRECFSLGRGLRYNREKSPDPIVLTNRKGLGIVFYDEVIDVNLLLSESDMRDAFLEIKAYKSNP